MDSSLATYEHLVLKFQNYKIDGSKDNTDDL